MNRRSFDLAVIISVCMCIVFSVCRFEGTCAEIRQDVLRLHVIASDNDERAQKAKLKVRDAILDERREIFQDNDNLYQARKKIRQSLPQIEEIAEGVLKDEGINEQVSVSLKKAYFPTRVYSDSVVLPAGYYDALRVGIGKGEGKNWWCVMFPPMCLSAASKQQAVLSEVLTEKEMKLINSKPKYDVRFWIVEKYWQWRDKIENR